MSREHGPAGRPVNAVVSQIADAVWSFKLHVCSFAVSNQPGRRITLLLPDDPLIEDQRASMMTSRVLFNLRSCGGCA